MNIYSVKREKTPLLTVLMPACNAEYFLRECLDAVLNQTFTDFDFYICDDGSRDHTLAILQEYATRDVRIKILSNEENIGIAATRNRLLSVLPDSAKYVAWIDADDVCFPERFQKQIEFLSTHTEIGGVGSSLDIIDETSCSIGFRHYPTDPVTIRKTLPRMNVLAQPSMMLRREVIDSIGEYSLECPVAQDYEYWLRAIEKYDFANLDNPLLHYRISKQQVKQSKLKQTLLITMKIQKEYFRRNHKKMPFSVFLHQMAERVLLLLPGQFILNLFCFLTYRKKMVTQ